MTSLHGLPFKKLTTALMLLILTLTNLPNGVGAFVIANCVAASNVTATPSSGGRYDFSMTLFNNCSFLKPEDFNYTGVTFNSGSNDAFTTANQSLYYLSSYGSSFTFSVGPISPGTYRPYLQIYSPKDGSNATYFLGSYTVQTPTPTQIPRPSEAAPFRFSAFNACFTSNLAGSYCFKPSENWVYISNRKSNGPFKFQELVGKKWVNSTGISDISKYEWTASLNKSPDYLVQIDFPAKTPGTYKFKLSWEKSGKYKAGSENITLKVVNP